VQGARFTASGVADADASGAALAHVGEEHEEMPLARRGGR